MTHRWQAGVSAGEHWAPRTGVALPRRSSGLAGKTVREVSTWWTQGVMPSGQESLLKSKWGCPGGGARAASWGVTPSGALEAEKIGHLPERERGEKTFQA